MPCVQFSAIFILESILFFIKWTVLKKTEKLKNHTENIYFQIHEITATFKILRNVLACTCFKNVQWHGFVQNSFIHDRIFAPNSSQKVVGRHFYRQENNLAV